MWAGIFSLAIEAGCEFLLSYNLPEVGSASPRRGLSATASSGA